MVRIRRNEKEKNHPETNEDAESGGRIASIPGNLKCPVTVITTYMGKLNSNCDNLWQRPKKNLQQIQDVWYYNSPLGHNKPTRITAFVSHPVHSLEKLVLVILIFKLFPNINQSHHWESIRE
jgi:hypothetical protein